MAVVTGQQRDAWLLGQRGLIAGGVGRHRLMDKVWVVEGTERASHTRSAVLG